MTFLSPGESGGGAGWLAAYPNIEVVSRDGAAQYVSAIGWAHPDAIQVRDCCHLIKNPADCAKQEHDGRRGGATAAKAGTEASQCVVAWVCLERLHEASTEKKQAVLETVRRLALRQRRRKRGGD